jgi:hypothetical protein
MLESLPLDEIGKEFQALWTCAVGYIKRLGEGSLTWFKGNLYAPLFEHFSFRLGNQLFFVRLEDLEARLQVPSTLDSLFKIAEACNGRALIMPMRSMGGIWLPTVPGWGLLDAKTRQPVNPKNLVTTDLIELTDWELHDMAVHGVVLSLGGKKLHSYTNHPGISPSIWYEGESGREWIIVRYAKYPELDAPPPGNWEHICESCLERGCGNGFFAVVVFAEKNPFTGLPSENKSLYREGNILIRFQPFRLFRKKGTSIITPSCDIPPKDESHRPSL